MVLGPMLWSLSTTDKSMLLIATRVETFTLSWESKIKQVSILGFKITKKLLKYIKPDIHKCECAGRKEKYSNYSNCVFFFFLLCSVKEASEFWKSPQEMWHALDLIIVHWTVRAIILWIATMWMNACLTN